MKKALSKLSLIAGICLLAAGSNQAFAQSCNTGYGGDVYFERCPTSYTAPSYGYNQSDYRDTRYNDYYAPQQNRSYQAVNTGANCQCAECMDNTRQTPAASSNISARLTHIETILAYIVNFLGIDTNTSTSGQTNERAPNYPQASTRAPASDNCAGGS